MCKISRNPTSKIIIIYNSGQSENDKITVDALRNQASLVDLEMKSKKVTVYNLCSSGLAGDMTEERDWAHEMSMELCFQFYNPVIMDFIVSRIY